MRIGMQMDQTSSAALPGFVGEFVEIEAQDVAMRQIRPIFELDLSDSNPNQRMEDGDRGSLEPTKEREAALACRAGGC